MINFGSTDPDNITVKVLKFLLVNNFKIEIQIISTKHSLNLVSLRKLFKLYKNKFTIILNPTTKELKQIYLDTDLCIGSCGISIWERIYYQIPNIIYKTNNVQRYVGKYLKEKKIIYELLDRNEVLSYNSVQIINKLIKNNYLSSGLVSRGQTLINKKAIEDIYNTVIKVVKMKPNKTILITGSTGFLGKALMTSFNNANNVIGLARSKSDMNCDLKDLKKLKIVFRDVKPDIVIHTAALVDVDICEKNKKKPIMKMCYQLITC